MTYAVVTATLVSGPCESVAHAEAWARAEAGDGWFVVVRGPTTPATVAYARAELARARRAWARAVALAWAEAAAEASADGGLAVALH